MKRAESEVITTPFFKLYKAANHINNIDAAKNLLYGILGDHGSLYPDCEYKSICAFLEGKITWLGGVIISVEFIFLTIKKLTLNQPK